MRSLLVGIILLSICQLGYTQPLIPGTIGTSQSICYNSAPAMLGENTPPSGGTGLYTRQWQSSTDNVSWTNVGRAGMTSYIPPALTQNMFYRLYYTSGSETASSNPIQITVIAEVNAGIIGSAQTICYNTNPGILTESTAPSGGTGLYTRQWQSSTDNTSWTNVGRTGMTSYIPPALTQSTYYRLNYTSGGCIANSAPVLITVNSAVTAGNIEAAQTICYNTIPVPLNQLNSPTGGNGTYTFQWQSSTDNTSWTNISGATYAYYSPSALTTTTWFRRLVTSGACLSQSTPSVLISVNAELTPGIIGSAQTICYNTIPEPLDQKNSPTGGTGIYSYQWQNSTDNITWINISGATQPYYSPPALTTSTWYRRLVTSGICAARSTSPVLITVNTILTAGTIGDNQPVLSGATPSPLIQLTAPTGGGGSYTYQWQTSTDGVNWSNIQDATLVGYSPTAIFADTWFRRVVTAGTCGSVVSNTVKITLTSPVTLYTSEVPGDREFSIPPRDLGTEFQVLTSGFITKVRLYSHPLEGGIHQIRIWRKNDQSAYDLVTGPIDWDFSTGTAGWREFDINPVAVEAGRNYIVSITNGAAANLVWVLSSPFTPANTNEFVSYLRGLFGATPGIVPEQDKGQSYFRDIVYIPFSSGAAGANQSICYNTAPSSLIQTIAPSGGLGTYTYQWQNSPDGSNWTNIQGATYSEYSPLALTVSTYYRRAVISGGLMAFSSPVLITVRPQIALAQLHDNLTILFNTSTNFNIAISGGTSPFTINYTINGIAQTAIHDYISGTNISTGVLTTGVYSYALSSVTDANGCAAQSLGTSITITASDNGNLTAGSIGSGQTICYNTAPAPLTQVTAPTGGTGVYTFQWQSSPDNNTWTDITGAVLSDYSPPVLTANTYFRRNVISGSYFPVSGSSVLITFLPQVTLAQLHDNITIEYNTSANFNVVISGGTSPFTVNYTRNGVAQPPINTYLSGADISTGVLTTGIYTYALTSVTDANGCAAQSLGTNIIVTVNSITLYTSEIPADREFSTPNPRDYGTEFQALMAGFITKVRLYSHTLEGGIHQIRLWRQNDQSAYDLVSGPIDWDFSAGTAGWREFDITPVAVEAGRNYIVSITNGAEANLVSVLSSPFTPISSNSYIRYLRGLFFGTPGNLPFEDKSQSYFRDIVFVPFSSGAAGVNQLICYNTAPSSLVQTLPPTGGFGTYTFQWQSSPDNLTWTNIEGATSSEYSPLALTVSTYYRRVVTSGSLITSSSPVLITVRPQIALAQLHDNITIQYNTSTNFNIAISGGTSPFTINYTINGIAQAAIHDYISATNIPTGILTTGEYTYALSSVTDADGCTAQSLGTSITIIATENGNLTAGTIGSGQTICYNTAPAPLTQITAPTGGTGVYTFQWQSSPDNNTWTDITGAVLSDYSPPVLTANTYFRRYVISGSYFPVPGSSVLITILPQVTLAQLHDNITIEYNTSTNFNVVISGGTSPFTVNYTRNGVAQPPINTYLSGADISTGVLTTGIYTYALTSVTDANGCAAQSLGTNIIVIVKSITLYTSEVPADREFSSSPRDLGTEFQVLAAGFITKVRLYCDPLEGGVHQIRLWRQNNQSVYELVTGPIDWDFSAGTAGWREFDITPVSVEAGRNYIVSITNGATDLVWVLSTPFTPVTSNSYIRYLRGLFFGTSGSLPFEDKAQSYFRDIGFIPFSPGIAGANQSICYNTVPSPFVQIVAPTGGLGTYSFQWQSSPNGSNWTNIQGATSSEYSPLALTVSTYYRRVITSSSLTTYGSPILINVDSPFTLAQLHNDITIYNNTSTNLNLAISGGTPPYRIEYTRNSTTQAPITGYISGTDIYTGVLATGTYEYALTSVKDKYGCEVQSRGNPVTVTVSGEYSGSGSSKALVIVNSASVPYYAEYMTYIKPYLKWFGVPFDTCDINSMTLPDFNNYALIIFGHRNVYPSGGYPITELETAINSGIGLYSFDPHLFDFESTFNTLGVTPHPQVISTQINLTTNHFITKDHENDQFNETNSVINLITNEPQPTITISETYFNLVEGQELATMSSDGNTAILLQVADYGSGHGRIVKWGSYDWAFDEKLGPVMGMDDIVWRGIVWAAKKPFVMQGLPPMMTMRMDDVKGAWGGSSIAENLEWLKISNEFGFIPWCGTFISNLTQATIDTLRDLINNGRATASPHSINADNFIYSNWDNSALDIAQNVRDASNFYLNNGLTMSKFLVPHWYLISSDALTEIRNMGIEYIGTDLPLDLTINTYPGNWLNCGPYRINRYGYAGYSQAFFYAGNVNWGGNNFFISLSEMRDIKTDFGIGGGEWIPTSFVITTSNQAVRHLRRALSSMVLPTLFTHEYQLDVIQPAGWRLTLDRITSAISSYNPEYKSMDDAVKYVRAKENINLTNVRVDNGLVSISCSGENDMETKCYLFNESNSVISYRLITLPRVNSSTVPVTVGVLNN
jgi:hypothetical protein